MGKNIETDQVISYVYIHVPFCLRKCNYCSFFSVEFTEAESNKYIDHLIKEIKLFKQRYKIKPKTIYFGGGTPSLLSADQINTVISQFDLSIIEEVTLECNPVNINNKYARELTSTPVNRISLGAQSFIDAELKILGRLHNSTKIKTAYKLLRKYKFNNISLDLIYGLPSQCLQEVEFSLDEIIKLEPEHISTYCLSLEKDVPLFSRIDLIPIDGKVSDFYYFIRSKLISTGFDHYEISNFAKKNYYSKHNLCYWNDENYLGLGPSAAGYIGNIRYNNKANLKDHYKMITENNIMLDQTILSETDHEKEYIFLGLRKAEGLNLVDFRNNFKTDFTEKYKHVVSKFNNLFYVNETDIALKPKAYFISNEIFQEFM
ncbi:MAG: radical SAM family heme chaperone HemW [Candidatus Tenebribacter davisii]|nr:radical SAM family heme chaperone HemW [Candidatus Tenebribacter davisii]